METSETQRPLVEGGDMQSEGHSDQGSLGYPAHIPTCSLSPLLPPHPVSGFTFLTASAGHACAQELLVLPQPSATAWHLSVREGSTDLCSVGPGGPPPAVSRLSAFAQIIPWTALSPLPPFSQILGLRPYFRFPVTTHAIRQVTPSFCASVF